MKEIEISESEIENVREYLISTLYSMDIFTENIFSDSIKHTNNIGSYMENNLEISKRYISTFISFYKFSEDRKNYSKLTKLIYLTNDKIIISDIKIPEINSYYNFIHSIIYALKIEILNCVKEYYELSEFERESVKCFGKNLFSGEEYNTPKYRELS